MSEQATRANGLTVDQIAQAAIELVDFHGPEALTFRRLGDALGVSQTTVHRHCDNSVERLLDLCVDHLAARLPDIDPAATWAEATEARFRALYTIMTEHPGLVALRGGRPWLGHRILARLVEPQLAANLAAGMSDRDMIVAYRQMYLFTLGSAAFVDHLDPAGAVQRTRTALAALPPDDFPVLTGKMNTILEAVVDHDVFHDGLRRLIVSAEANHTA
ncbi:TetR/AcrR family transcriptional regulator [Streptomyces sp. NPDC059875]|uniref:TetR/AcrR family transcriptional regulator n=1 Tax=unclassified Streptomyces TaxID=2593676 RepID=UPI00364728FE